MRTPPAPTNVLVYLVHTRPGEGVAVATDRFPTGQDRLQSLRKRAQAYFPGRTVPPTPAGADEAAYLAQLLGFFLMLNDGSVTLEDVTHDGE